MNTIVFLILVAYYAWRFVSLEIRVGGLEKRITELTNNR